MFHSVTRVRPRSRPESALEARQEIVTRQDELNARMKAAESDMSAFQAEVAEGERLEGIDKKKQRTAMRLAAAVIETAVGDKLEKMIKEKL